MCEYGTMEPGRGKGREGWGYDLSYHNVFYACPLIVLIWSMVLHTLMMFTKRQIICVWSVRHHGGASALPERLRLVCYFLLVMHLPFLNANAPILLCLPGSAEFLHCQPPCYNSSLSTWTRYHYTMRMEEIWNITREVLCLYTQQLESVNDQCMTLYPILTWLYTLTPHSLTKFSSH